MLVGSSLHIIRAVIILFSSLVNIPCKFFTKAIHRILARITTDNVVLNYLARISLMELDQSKWLINFIPNGQYSGRPILYF